MKPKTITPATEFILWLHKNMVVISTCNELSKSCADCRLELLLYYACLMQTPLLLEMFVAVNDKQVLKEPKEYKDWLNEPIINGHFPVGINCEKYHKAKTQILFEGFEYEDGLVINKKEMQQFSIQGTIEQLAAVIPLEVNANFWKRIGLKVSNQIQ